MCAPNKKTLNRGQILRQKADVDTLFEKGRAFVAFPIKAVVREILVEDTINISVNCSDLIRPDLTGKVMFSVPKRLIKKAVNRNKVRRRIKEAYRINQIIKYDIAFIYISKEIHNFTQIENAVKNILQKITHISGDNLG